MYNAEELILEMAEIVYENRRLRKENQELLKEREEHREFVNNLVDTSFKNTASFLNNILSVEE